MPGRIFNSFLILFGVIVMLLAVGAMTQTVIELELNQFFGKRRIKNMIDKLDGHFIVCGYGRVGRGAADELQKAGASFRRDRQQRGDGGARDQGRHARRARRRQPR